MNFPKLGNWLAIFFLANIRVSCGQDMSTSFGFPRPGDSIYTQHIHMDRKTLRSVSHTTGFSIDNGTINAVQFKDIWKTGAKIELKKSPPFEKLEVKFTSMINRGYYFIMEVHYSDMTYNDKSFIILLLLFAFIFIFCIINN